MHYLTHILLCKYDYILVIECDTADVSNNKELNFTLSSTGRAVPGETISYVCSNEEQKLVGSNITECLSDGTWSSPLPRCNSAEISK